MPRSRTVLNTHRQSAKVQRHEDADLRAIIANHKIIPAVRAEADLVRAVAAPSQVVYLLAGSLSTLDQYMQILRSADKEVMVNLDLFSGLARDSQAVGYLASSGISGIISTHTDVLNAAMANGLFAIQRTFMIDSGSVESTMRSLRHFVPNALELLPAPVAPRILPLLQNSYSNIATIAGGLISSLAEADELVRAGIDAVSTGNPELWLI